MNKLITVLLLIILATGAIYAKGKQEQSILIHVEDVEEMLADGDVIFLDIRDNATYQRGHVPGALLLPLPAIDQAAESLGTLSATFVAYCSCPAEESSMAAALQLRAAGIKNIYVLVGGYPEWIKQKKPIVTGPNPL